MKVVCDAKAFSILPPSVPNRLSIYPENETGNTYLGMC